MPGSQRQVKFRTVRHYDVPDHAHYLTFSCWHRNPFLSVDRTRKWMLESLTRSREIHAFDLWAWVIMPEHVHVLVLPRDGVLVKELLKCIKQPVAQRAVSWVRGHRPEMLASMRDLQPNGRCNYRFWQPGCGYDRNIFTMKELHEKIGYIHANPVRRGLAAAPGDWPWSSWQAWETGQDLPIRIDRESLPQLIP